MSSAQLKAELLSNGVSLSKEFLENYGAPYIEKRRAYGNSDHSSFQNVVVPQELYIGEPKVVCSVNIRPTSKWILDYNGDYIVRHALADVSYKADFPLRPAFYDSCLPNGQKINSIATLYGGGALGIFVYGSCALVKNNKACRYCSIQTNRSVQTEFEEVVTGQQIYDSIISAVTTDRNTVSQIMINGGNFKDSDKSFSYYIEVCRFARKALDDLKSDIEIHLIAYPPVNTELYKELADLDVSLAMNTEAFDIDTFSYICPGKNAEHIRQGLEKAVSALGRGKVYSILVGGLEPIESLERGLHALGKLGVTPIINVFHPDPGTDLETKPAPSVSEILSMGSALQNVYSKYNFMKPFYNHCGRNAIDTEAALGLFNH